MKTILIYAGWILGLLSMLFIYAYSELLYVSIVSLLILCTTIYYRKGIAKVLRQELLELNINIKLPSKQDIIKNTIFKAQLQSKKVHLLVTKIRLW